MPKENAEINFKLETSGDSIVIGCPEQLDISVVNELNSLLNEQIGQCSSIELNAEQVERADAAALQLLTIFAKDANAQEINVKWQNPSVALINAVNLLGLQNELGLVSASPHI